MVLRENSNQIAATKDLCWSPWSWLLLPHIPPHGQTIEISASVPILTISSLSLLLNFNKLPNMPMLIQSSCEGFIPSSPTSPSRESRIRMNYLSKLGISPAPMLRRNSERSISKVSSSSSLKQMRRVRFDDDASTIIHIPSHRTLDPRDRKNMWYTWAELQEAASRNAMDEWKEADPVEKHEIMNVLAFIQATYQRECQLQVFQSNKQLAIRNACLRPPVRPDQFMVWPQYQ